MTDAIARGLQPLALLHIIMRVLLHDRLCCKSSSPLDMCKIKCNISNAINVT